MSNWVKWHVVKHTTNPKWMRLCGNRANAGVPAFERSVWFPKQRQHGSAALPSKSDGQAASGLDFGESEIHFLDGIIQPGNGAVGAPVEGLGGRGRRHVPPACLPALYVPNKIEPSRDGNEAHAITRDDTGSLTLEEHDACRRRSVCTRQDSELAAGHWNRIRKWLSTGPNSWPTAGQPFHPIRLHEGGANTP